MPVRGGAPVSSDVGVVDGEPVWWRHSPGLALGDGTFAYWTVQAEPLPALEAYGGEWLRRHLPGYSGFVNLETIGGTIIEAHLRVADQWGDLYGAGRGGRPGEVHAHGRLGLAGPARPGGHHG